MNTVCKMTVVCILAILVVVFSSGSKSMIQVNAQQRSATIEPQISNIPEIRECQMLHPLWNSAISPNNATADRLFTEKDCWKQLARDPITGEPLK